MEWGSLMYLSIVTPVPRDVPSILEPKVRIAHDLWEHINSLASYAVSFSQQVPLCTCPVTLKYLSVVDWAEKQDRLL